MENISNSDVRVNNRKRLVNILFHRGEMTKQELVNELGISLATVNFLVKELMEKGLLTTGSAQQSTGGRKPVCVRPVYEARFSIGAEAAKDVLHIVILDLGINVVAKTSIPMRMENTLSYWKRVGELIREFGQNNEVPRELLLDVGITLGVTMADENLVERKAEKQEFGMDLNLARQGLGMPVHFRNSTKMAALANCWKGTKDEDFVFIYLGLKISAAFVHHHEVIDFAGVNGELGCMILDTLGDSECPYHLDDVFSRETICRTGNVENLPAFFEKCQTDVSCRTYFEKYICELAKLLHNLYCIFGWKIVIGGSISPYLKPHLEAMQEQIRREYPFTRMKEEFLSLSELAEYGAAVGAAMLAIDRFLEFGVNEE